MNKFKVIERFNNLSFCEFLSVYLLNLHDSKLRLFNCLVQDADTDKESDGAGSGHMLGWRCVGQIYHTRSLSHLSCARMFN